MWNPLKVSKFQKQIFLFSFESKTKRNYPDIKEEKKPWAFQEKNHFNAPDMYTIPESDSCTYSVHKRTNHKNNIPTYF